jgi:hypothetical protein
MDIYFGRNDWFDGDFVVIFQLASLRLSLAGGFVMRELMWV